MYRRATISDAVQKCPSAKNSPRTKVTPTFKNHSNLNFYKLISYLIKGLKLELFNF